MKKTKLFFERWGIHSFLLPVFFVFHTYRQYDGLVSSDTAIKVLLYIIAFFLIFFLLILLITKNKSKSLVITTITGSVILFFGVIKDLFQYSLHMPFIAKWIVVLPLTVLIVFLIIIVILKRKQFKRINLFLNLLLIIFIMIEFGILILAGNTFSEVKNLLVRNDRLALNNLPNPSSKPDVFYLVLDCYPGTPFLMDHMDFDNSSFDSALMQKGFYIVRNPKSNYNRTAFSISSTLNFEYLNLENTSHITAKDYNRALLTVKNSMVPKIFDHHNYTFYNLSIFDIAGTSAIRKESFLTLPQQDILLYNTLPGRIKNELLWNFSKRKNTNTESEFKKINRERAELKDYNQQLIDSLKRIPFERSGKPKFIYAHLYMPHPPFFYDENGKDMDMDIDSVLSERSFRNKSRFLSYLKYTNHMILEITDKILQAGGSNNLIILQSDHGFTDFEGGPTEKKLFFENYSAIYFPGKEYSAFYDTLSNVNTFPILFNTYFNTQIPLQKDSSVFLSY